MFISSIITIIIVEFILLLGSPISVILKEIRLYAYRKPYHNSSNLNVCNIYHGFYERVSLLCTALWDEVGSALWK